MSREAFEFSHRGALPEILESLQATLLVTTYQAGKLAALRVREGKLSLLVRSFGRAMGLAVAAERIAIATDYQIWTLRNCPEMAPRVPPVGQHDACFLPRTSHVTGDIDVHEIAWGSTPVSGGDAAAELWVVNTLFSCLATLSPDFSFVPRWKPNFISRIERGDHCHLNGLAMHAGRPAWVTAHGSSSEPLGWRAMKADGGVVIDVPSGEIVARGLSMPHSPRLYGDRLWVLDSGRGRLVTIDRRDGHLETVCQFESYARGLAFAGSYAVVGLSRIRETAVFGGVPIAEGNAPRPCGLRVVDLRTGLVTAALDFTGKVAEVFDVQWLPRSRFPAIVGFEKDTIRRACVIGPYQEVWPR